MVALESLLSSFDVDRIPTEALMFQAGYLTISIYEKFATSKVTHGTPSCLSTTICWPSSR